MAKKMEVYDFKLSGVTEDLVEKAQIFATLVERLDILQENVKEK